MQQVLDGLRRYISRWARTTTPLISDCLATSDIVTVRTTRRFDKNSEVMLRRVAKAGEEQAKYEWYDDLKVIEVIDDTHLQLSRPVQFNWLVEDGATLAKCMYGQFLQGIYIGDPENISHFPAVTVNGLSETSEWLTIDSTKDTYNVEIGVFVQDTTQENGYRFLMQMAKLIKYGLSQNIFPLVNDYATTGMTADVLAGTKTVYVQDASLFCPAQMVLLEDQHKTAEHRVKEVFTAGNYIELLNNVEDTYYASDGPIVIVPNRFIMNSYPKTIQYGKIHKGTLLKAAVIEWFGEEEVHQNTRRGGMLNSGSWTDTQIR